MQVSLPLTVKIIVDHRSKDAPFVAYSPEVDVASCGPTEEKARENLHEAISIVLDTEKQSGNLSQFFEDLGFQKQKKQWVPPRVSFEPFSFSL